MTERERVAKLMWDRYEAVDVDISEPDRCVRQWADATAADAVLFRGMADAILADRTAQREQDQRLRAFWLDLWEIFSDGEGGDIDQEAFLAAAMSARLVVQRPYDPEGVDEGEHIWGDPEPGDMIYTLAPLPAEAAP